MRQIEYAAVGPGGRPVLDSHGHEDVQPRDIPLSEP